MKKKILMLTLAVLILAFAVVLFLNHGGAVRDVQRIPTESMLYTDEEIQMGMDIAIQAFSEGFDGCKLLTIAYDEEETLAETQRRGEEDGERKILVLVSSFFAGKNAEACFNPNMVYTGWKWILQDSGDGWEMIGSGYA